MRALVVAGCLALTALSGCAVERDDAGTLPDTPSRDLVGAPATGFSLAGCESRYGFVPVPAEWAEARVPEGFGPGLVPVAGPAPDSSPWLLAVAAFSCLVAHPEELEGRTAQGVMFFVPVDPPDDMEAADRDTHFAVLAVRVDDAALADIFHGWGVPNATATSVSWEAPLDSTVVREGTARIDWSGAQLELDVGVLAAAEGTGDVHDRLFIVASGADGQPTVASMLDFEATSNPPSTPGAAVVRSTGADLPDAELRGQGAWTRGFEMSFVYVDGGPPP